MGVDKALCSTRCFARSRASVRLVMLTRLVSRSELSRSITQVVVWAVLASAATGCAVVPQSRRQYLADPTMQRAGALERGGTRKLYLAREIAAGGDARAAGGGCSCSN